MSAKTITVSRLATFLSSPRAQLEHTVVDHTGLSGTFTFKLEWTPDDKQGADRPGDRPGPSPPMALQEQLGLKLETGKAPMKILVIDHAEPPPKTDVRPVSRIAFGYCEAPIACSRSQIRSSTSSMPTEILTRSLLTPASICCSSLNC